MTWEEICADPFLAKSPYRIETDKWGNIVMSPPASGFHSFSQGRIVILLDRLMVGGYGAPECPVLTAAGVKAMDAAWVSKERFAQLPASGVYQTAPEICVEVRSPSNSFQEIQEKLQLYFGAGATECWMCDRNGQMSFYNAEGPIRRSRLCPDFPEQVD